MSDPGVLSTRSCDAASAEAVLARAAAAMQDLAEVDCRELGEAELTNLILGFGRLRGSFEVAEAHAVQAFDAAGVWALDGARSASTWLAWRRHCPVGEARRLVRHAHLARRHPAIEAAWRDGAIGPSHLAALGRLDTPRTHDAFLEGHQALVDAGRSQHWRHFTRACRYWELHADPDGAARGDEAGRAARALHLHQTYDGQWFGRLDLDPVAGSILHGAVTDIERELLAVDRSTARDRLGRAPHLRELARTPAQRRADALVEMAVRARTAPVGGKRPRPLVSVLVGYETFAGSVCELFNRTVLTPAGVASLLSDADVERIVFDTPSRVMDVGRSTRFYRGALRHAIEIRDRSCWHPSCDEQPQQPEVDHVEEFFAGGPTTQANGRWGCAFHNHHRTWPRALEPPLSTERPHPAADEGDPGEPPIGPDGPGPPTG